MMMLDAMKQTASVSEARDRQQREFDTFVEAEHKQLSSLTGVMRRVEDLADRLLGATPTSDGENSAKEVRSGAFGALLDAHETRDLIGRRISDALNRIEKVL